MTDSLHNDLKKQLQDAIKVAEQDLETTKQNSAQADLIKKAAEERSIALSNKLLAYQEVLNSMKELEKSRESAAETIAKELLAGMTEDVKDFVETGVVTPEAELYEFPERLDSAPIRATPTEKKTNSES